MIIIHAQLTIKPEAEELFLDKAQHLLTASRAEEGNIRYELFRHTEQSNVFIVVEQWKDREAIAFHNQAPHFTGFFAEAGQWFAAPPQIESFVVEKSL